MTEHQRGSILDLWQQVRSLLSAGFSVEQATKLLQLRDASRRGAFQDGDDGGSRSELARLGFARYLVETGRLRETLP